LQDGVDQLGGGGRGVFRGGVLVRIVVADGAVRKVLPRELFLVEPGLVQFFDEQRLHRRAFFEGGVGPPVDRHGDPHGDVRGEVRRFRTEDDEPDDRIG
jgi:hypothetical protein